MNFWFSENHTPNVKISIRVDRQLYSGKSEFQRIDVFDSPEFGRFLTLDGYMMLTEKDEFIYHEMITHVPMAVHPLVKKVLVIGAGDGGVIRELTRYPEIEHIDMVEIDPLVVEVCRKYLPKTACRLDDPRLSIHYEDGLKYVRFKENEYDLIRYEKARKKPYFGRIDFKDGISQEEETCYIGRAGIAKNGSEPVVLDWRAPIASVYYESSMGPCTYTVSSEGTYEMDLVRKRTYEIEQDVLKDFFDSDVVANDELLTKYLAKNKKAVLGEIIATIQKEQNVIIRRSPRTNVIIQGVAGSGKTTVAMHRISFILYNYKDDFRPEDFYIVGSNRILLNYITSVLPELDVYGIRQLTMEQLFVRLL